jgi:hypothetical protein
MSPGSFASSIDEPANDKFESSDLPGLNHLTDQGEIANIF